MVQFRKEGDLADAIVCVSEATSDSTPYQLCRGQSPLFDPGSEGNPVRLLTVGLKSGGCCDMSVGRTIKFARTAAGLKQKDLADRLDVSANYLSLVENDKREPSISFLRNFAGEMGIPLGLLFLDVDSDLSEVSPEERALLLRIQDLVFQIQQIKLHSEAGGDDRS